MPRGSSKKIGRDIAQQVAGKKIYNFVANSLKKTKSSPRRGNAPPVQNRTMELSRAASDSSSYELALVDPFNVKAVGARVPDAWCFPTATHKTQSTTIISSDASGNACLLLTPHPYLSMINLLGGTVSSTGLAQYGTQGFFAEVTESNMSSVAADFRVVAAGFTVSNLLTPTSATGRFMAARIPMVGVPGTHSITNSLWDKEYLTQFITGVLPTAGAGVGSSTILDLPESTACTMQELITTEFMAGFRPIGPGAFDFSPSTNATRMASAGSNAYGVQTVNTVTGASSGVGTDNSMLVAGGRGWDCYFLRFEGCPANTIIAQIRSIQHVEGSPVQVSSSGSLASASQSKVSVDIAGFNKTLSRVLTRPSTAYKMAASVLNGAQKAATIGAKLGLLL